MVKRYAKTVLVLLAVMFGLLQPQRVQSQQQNPEDEPALTASGVLQARQIAIASEFGGPIAQVLVGEGDVVDAGQVVVRLDAGLLDAQIAVAEAGVAAAEAGLRRAEAGARPGQIAVAEAQLAQAQAGVVAARQAVSDTQALVDTPQDIDLQIAALRGQLEAAEQRRLEATAQKDAAEVAKNAFEEAYTKLDGGGVRKFLVREGQIDDLLTDTLPPGIVDLLPPDIGQNAPNLGDQTLNYRNYELRIQDGQYALSVWKDLSFPLNAHLLPNLWWQSWVGVNAATATVEGLESRLAQLYTQRAHPQAMEARLDEAVAAAAQLAAQAEMADVQLRGLRAGLTPQELAAIQAQVDQAYAGLNALLDQREMLSLTTPISGTVVDIVMRPGEVAAQGATLLTVADLADMNLTVYVPEADIGQLWLGQPVELSVDSFPGRTFGGRVSYVADWAEFTPRHVATEEERQTLVFAVRIQVTEGTDTLKPGMPADVRFLDAQRGS